MEYTIQPYQSAHFASLVDLLAEAFHLDSAIKVDLIRWKFFDAYHAGKTISYVALEEAGKVVSQYTNFPVSVQHNAACLPAMICADMATHPDHRGRGLISRLSRCVYADVVASGAQFSIGFSTDEGVKVDQNATGYGYRIVGQFQRLFHLIVRRTATPFHLRSVERFEPDRVPTIAPVDRFSVAKSWSYLDWRYCRKPTHDYLIYELWAGAGHAGYVVMRERGGKCYVLDIIADLTDLEQAALILKAIHNTILERGQRICLYYVLPNRFWQERLRGCLALPAQLQRNHHYLTVKPHDPRWQPVGRIDDPDRWLLMAGDIL